MFDLAAEAAAAVADPRPAHARLLEMHEAGATRHDGAPHPVITTRGVPLGAADAFPDELDRAFEQPVSDAAIADAPARTSGAARLTAATDPALTAAVEELRIRTLAAIAGRVGSAAEEERIAARLTSISAHRTLALRTRFYHHDDGPARVTPWVSPARLELQRQHYVPHARRYSPAMSEFMRLTTDQLVEAGVLRRLGRLGSPFQAYAVAHAVVAAKKPPRTRRCSRGSAWRGTTATPTPRRAACRSALRT